MARKKKQQMAALLDPETCTGCEACRTICPVQCITTVAGERPEQSHVCHVDVPNCIGCTLCNQVCPWDCISMVATDEFLQRQRQLCGKAKASK